MKQYSIGYLANEVPLQTTVVADGLIGAINKFMWNTGLSQDDITRISVRKEKDRETKKHKSSANIFTNGLVLAR